MEPLTDTYAASVGGAAYVGCRDLAAEVVKGCSPMRGITEVTTRPIRNRAIVRASVKRSHGEQDATQAKSDSPVEAHANGRREVSPVPLGRYQRIGSSGDRWYTATSRGCDQHRIQASPGIGNGSVVQVVARPKVRTRTWVSAIERRNGLLGRPHEAERS